MILSSRKFQISQRPLSSIVAFQIVSEELMHVGVGRVKGLRHVQSGRHRNINGVKAKKYTYF